MIAIKNLTIETLKGRKLIQDLSLTLKSGDKLAIIGEEGNGKSTLVKAIYNPKLIANYCSVTGSINLNGEVVGYLEQKLANLWADCTLFEYFAKEFPDGEIDYSVYEKIHIIENKLKLFGVDKNILDENFKIKNLSGGEQVKLQITKLLLSNPTLLLLDEPTNDLDIETLIWLEDFISSFPNTVIFISHDETLLEKCANQILHIEQLIKKSAPKHTLSKCGYEEYVNNRKRNIEHQTQIAYSERREHSKKEEVLRQIKQKVENGINASKKNPSNGRILVKKMANIKAQENKLENEALTEVPNVEEAISMIVDKSVTVPNQKVILDLNLPTLVAGEKILASNIKLKIVGPEKIAIVGSNGCGKTTLIKQIVNQLKNISSLKVGYFSQNYAENLNYNLSAIQNLQDLSSNPQTMLGCLNFTKEEMESKISCLSEGQKAKILLSKLLVEKNNVLILDEPTRNLSPLSIPVIRQMLTMFNGAIITVSHDRKFINEICNKVYVLTNTGLKETNL